MPQPDFEAAYDEHVARIYGFFAYRLGSRAEAEDLTQATFERALGAWPRFDPSRAAPATWLLAIARNLLIDHLRAQATGRRDQVALDGVPAGALPHAAGPETQLGLSPELEQALETLGERERELIALRYGGDLTGPELARLTGLSLANVQQILSRSLRRLRAALEDAQKPSGPTPPRPSAARASSRPPGTA